MNKTALITGVSGQDGFFLAQLLTSKGYRVVGTSRRPAPDGQELDQQLEVLEWDLRDTERIQDILRSVSPSEVYNLAAMASGEKMFDDAVEIGESNGLAVARILEAIRTVDSGIRFCQASSSEMFGDPVESPQSETTSFQPRSPYGAAKLYAHEMVGIYRQRHGLFACSAILFNHESERRGAGFVTGKVAQAVAQIKLGLSDKLELGNLEASRDWGFAGDYVRGMWLMLQADHPDDFVLATGVGRSVRELCETAFSHVDLDYRDFVVIGEKNFRTDEVLSPLGDPSKIARELGWQAETRFEDMVGRMVDAQLNLLEKNQNDRGADA